MSIESLSSEDAKKLKRAIDEAIAAHTRISDERAAVSDMLKTVSEDLNLNIKAVRAAVKAAIKDNVDEEKELAEETETILQVCGRR